ncbi:8349_t:CDS:2, partial [Gigaspora rosea]
LSNLLVYLPFTNGYIPTGYSYPLAVLLIPLSITNTEAIMEKLVEAVNKMTLQLQEKRKPPREPSKEFLAKVVCFRCSKPDPKPTTASATNVTLQTLLSLLEDKDKKEKIRDQHGFLSLCKESLPLYLPASRHERRKPISTLTYQRRKKDQDKLASVDEEAPLINDLPMEKAKPEANQVDKDLNKVKTLPNEPVPIDKPAYQEKVVIAEVPKEPTKTKRS